MLEEGRKPHNLSHGLLSKNGGLQTGGIIDINDFDNQNVGWLKCTFKFYVKHC